jgi:hypothetical protein
MVRRRGHERTQLVGPPPLLLAQACCAHRGLISSRSSRAAVLLSLADVACEVKASRIRFNSISLRASQLFGRQVVGFDWVLLTKGEG